MTTTAIPGGAPLHGAAEPWPELPRPRRQSAGSVLPAGRGAHAGAEGCGRVIVGLHGTEHADSAIAVGLAEAQRRGADLVVTVVHEGTDEVSSFSTSSTAPAATPEVSDEGEFLARLVQSAAVHYPTVRVTVTPCTGPFVRVLLKLAERAELVVLGDARRLGDGARDLIGLSHAACPVIVVRETAPPVRSA